jgi:hypothetical protein
MGSISQKQLLSSLDKAKGVGKVEEGFILDDCEVVLRNLRPDEYESIVDETESFEDIKYLNKWQLAHLCRAIVELNGVDLRDVSYVEVEEPDPKDKTRLRLIKRELHDWLLKNILSTWSKEAVFVAYRKFSDVVHKAENKAKDKVTFVLAEETAEDKYRRLLGEMKEIEEEVPPQILKMILEENGYTLFTRPQDEKALEDLDQSIAEPQPQQEEVSASPPPATAPPVQASNTVSAEAAREAAKLMRQRVPLNQQVVNVPEIVRTPPSTPIITPPPTPVQEQSTPVSKRAAEIAALMGQEPGVMDEDLDQMRAPAPQAVLPPGMTLPPNVPQSLIQPNVPTAKPVLTKQGTRHTDIGAVASILEQKPQGVMNPKFRPTPR